MSEPLQDIVLDAPNAGVLENDAAWWAIYDQSFPANERESRDVIVGSVRDGAGAAMRASLHGRTVGLATVHLLTNPPAVFLVYLAIAPDLRGRGTGARLLQATWELGASRLAGKGLIASGMIWEVDAPEFAADAVEEQRRRRRIEFFRCQGGILLPQPYLQPPLSGNHPVPMRLMHRPSAGLPALEHEQVGHLVRAIYFEKYGRANGIAPETLVELLARMSSSGEPSR